MHCSLPDKSSVPMPRGFHLGHRKLKSKFRRLSADQMWPLGGMLLSKKWDKLPRHLAGHGWTTEIPSHVRRSQTGWNVRKRQTYRDRKLLVGAWVWRREQGWIVTEHEGPYWEGCGCTTGEGYWNHWLVYLKWVNFMIYVKHASLKLFKNSTPCLSKHPSCIS